MNKYKVGQKVKVVRYDGFSKAENSMVGEFGKIEFVYEGEAPFPYKVRTDNAVGCFGDEELEPLTKTLYYLEVGDVLVNEVGDEKMVLGICGKVYFLSCWNSFNEYGDVYTLEEIKEGFTLKGSDTKKSELLLKAEALEQQAKQIREDVEKL